MSQSTQETVKRPASSPSAEVIGSQARARLVLIVTRLNEILKAAPMDWETRNRLERSLIDVDWVLNHFAAPTGSAITRCPFCGSSRVYVRFYNQPSVVCEDCLCMGPAAQHLTLDPDNKGQCEQEAVLRWNKRVDYSHKITLETPNGPHELRRE